MFAWSLKYGLIASCLALIARGWGDRCAWFGYSNFEYHSSDTSNHESQKKLPYWHYGSYCNCYFINNKPVNGLRIYYITKSGKNQHCFDSIHINNWEIIVNFL